MKPLNGNVLVEPLRDQTQAVFKEADSRKDLQYAKVLEVCEGSKLRHDEKIVYNPRNLTNITYEGKLLGVVHENNIIAHDI